MKLTKNNIIHGSLFLGVVLLSACGGGGSNSGAAANGSGSGGSGGGTVSTYSIGGTVAGMSGTGLVLQNNAGDDLTISANGTISFATKIASGTAYAVTVKTQPKSPSQICSVSNGSGKANANVVDISVTCSTNAYTVSGTVSGLSGSGLVLQNNYADDLAVSASGAFSFVTKVADSGGYNVSVKTQPGSPVQTCTVNSGSGTVAGAAVTGVTVTCATNAYAISGIVSGLVGTGLVLQNNGGDFLGANADGIFSFATNVASGAGYSVSVKSQPTLPAQNCTVGNGSGAVTSANINTVTVSCALYAPRFAYSANYLDGTLSSYTVNATTGQLRHNGYVTTGNGPIFVTTDPTGSFVYTANMGAGTISAYSINGSTGALTSIGADVTTDITTNNSQPRSIAVDPSGKFAYVANGNSGNVAQFTIGKKGALTPMTPATVTAGAGAFSITTNPTGKFVYVANASANTVSAYTINGVTGALTSVGADVPAGTAPYSVTVDSSGKFAYVANFTSNNISAYSINGDTGVLTSLGTVPAGTNPYIVTVDPSGKFAYVSNYGSNNVSAYSINATTGALTAVSGSPFAAGTAPFGVTVDPSGKFVYVENTLSNDVSSYGLNTTTGALTSLTKVAGRNNNSVLAMVRGTAAVSYIPKFAYAANFSSSTISQYSINSTTGTLTSAGADVAAGTNPYSVAVSPSAKFAYVANVATNDISIFKVNATSGVLSSIATLGIPGIGGNPGVPGIVGTVSAGTGPVAVTVDPSGKFVYVANSTSGDVSVYSVNATTGELTQLACGTAAVCNVTIIPATAVTPAITIPGANFLAGVSPSAITVDPTGQFVYVTNGGGNISAYSINTTTGALTSLGATVTAGVNPQSIAIDASGKYAYVANNDVFGASANNSNAFVSQYSIGSNGVLTPMTPATVLAAGQPLNVAADPSGKYVYVTNANGTMSQYTIGATGGLTPMVASVAGPTAPLALTVDPSGKFVYRSSINATNPTTAAGSISIYTIDATGALISGSANTSTGAGPYSITTTGTIQ
jgi:6-phosphogluconolactonase (cycloisomerase 2 family)